MCGQVVCEQVVSGQVVCVNKLCMRRREAADGIQNQKQEPHTKMWGKNMNRKGELQTSHISSNLRI